MKKFNGKAIYCPSGKAGEYAEYACNFYVGCSNGCEYCYCKKGRSAKWLGGDTPTLKKCFRDEDHALQVFDKELLANLAELREHGLFFSFTTDPMLPETYLLTMNAMNACHCNNIPVKVLTKCTAWVDRFIAARAKYGPNSRINSLTAIGFTLTGHDELEPHASTNAERIEAMRQLHNAGFKTFASIEPVVDIPHSKLMIENSIGYCCLYKIGLLSGRKFPREDVRAFVQWVLDGGVVGLQPKFYFKDGLLAQAGIDRERLPTKCVGRDYNIFK